uniref:Uncharacterized protein n=1 Tax=Anguilla anguilla TaxID=7936 RepID=A0A0E9XJE2_ANGAN
MTQMHPLILYTYHRRNARAVFLIAVEFNYFKETSATVLFA